MEITYLSVNLLNFAVVTVFLLLKIAGYRLWLKRAQSSEGCLLDMRRLKKLPFISSDNDFIGAYKIGELGGVVFVRKCTRMGSYTPPDKVDIFTVKEKAKSGRDNKELKIGTLLLVALGDFIMLSIVGNIFMYCHEMLLENNYILTALLSGLSTVAYLIGFIALLVNFYLYNLAWGKLYRFLYYQYSVPTKLSSALVEQDAKNRFGTVSVLDKAGR